MNKLHLKMIEGDKAFYYRNIDGDFHGGVLTHVDDFELTGTDDFVKEILKVVENELTISKVEKTASDTQDLMLMLFLMG